MINYHWIVLEFYLKWSTITEVYFTCTLKEQLSLMCTWLVTYMMNSHWGVLEEGIWRIWHNLCISPYYSFRLINITHFVYAICISLRILPVILRFTGADYTFRIFKLSLCLIWSLWRVFDLYLSCSTLTEVFLTCILNDQFSLRITWLVP